MGPEAILKRDTTYSADYCESITKKNKKKYIINKNFDSHRITILIPPLYALIHSSGSGSLLAEICVKNLFNCHTSKTSEES